MHNTSTVCDMLAELYNMIADSCDKVVDYLSPCGYYTETLSKS